MKIYVASSWRNPHQPGVVAALAAAGHDVYDFRHPEPGSDGFHWSDVDPNWKEWGPEQAILALNHGTSQYGFCLDMEALKDCNACVLVLPSGRSAHIEAGYAIGRGKPTIIYMPDQQEPELMYLMANCIRTELEDVLRWAAAHAFDMDNERRR